MGGLTVYYHIQSIFEDPALLGPDRRTKAFAFLGNLLRDPSVIKLGPDIGQDNIRLRAEQTRVDGLPDGILLAPLGGATLYFHVRHILDDQRLSDAPPVDRFAEAFRS